MDGLKTGIKYRIRIYHREHTKPTPDMFGRYYQHGFWITAQTEYSRESAERVTRDFIAQGYEVAVEPLLDVRGDA